jgi:hypothetical protein
LKLKSISAQWTEASIHEIKILFSIVIHIVTCTPEERRYLVMARQQLRKEALLGNGWPQQYQARVFYGVRSQAITPRDGARHQD